MLRPAHLFALALLTVAGCATVGPDSTDLASALGVEPSRIRDIRCRGYVEEPTEFSCRYRTPNGSGRWVTREAVVAIDGSTWINIGP